MMGINLNISVNSGSDDLSGASIVSQADFQDLRQSTALFDDLVKVVEQVEGPAKQLLLEREQGLEVVEKADGSRVTNADLRMNSGLERILPGIRDLPIVSEENTSAIDSLSFTADEEWWLIDPIDGTQTFLDGFDAFSVCIALMKGFKPIAGVIAFPDLDQIYFAASEKGAYKLNTDSLELVRLDSSVNLQQAPSLASFFNETGAGLDQLMDFARVNEVAETNIVKVPASQKYCYVAEGRYSYGGGWRPIKLWDLAAAEPIVVESGGMILDPVTGSEIVFDPRQLKVERAMAVAAGSGFLTTSKI